MRRPLIALLPAAALTAGLLVTAPAVQADPTGYYLALGDSLAAGYQPAHGSVPAGDTDEGYVNDLYATLPGAADGSLQLQNLGCSGETTTSMISGGICNYAEGSQLNAAVAFITAHPGQIKYLTLDIGANDVDKCAPGGSIDAACVLQGIGTIAKNLNTILSALKKADHGTPVSIGMNYYDPFLQYWTTGLQGELVATASVALLVAINTVEQTLYGLYGFKVANVFTAYKTANFSKTPQGTPINVQTICTLTYMCSVQNIHPNAQGYQVIANAFAAKLG
ncbi:MAG TPA: SGNH/GDSL hydrolase family protein [Jatrophihabitantaceae bacterium]|nr:SGNH/GDSL hydrolase family protein [Jatrophihabitantaceae bacterium]